MRPLFQWLCAAALAVLPVTASAQETVAPPDGTQTVTLSLLHKKPNATWSEIDISRGAPLMRFKVNGQIVCGVIDTGADRTTIDLDFARAQGLTVAARDQGVMTSGGVITSSRVLAVPVEVEGQFRFDAELVGVDLPDYACPFGGSLRFALGMDILRHIAVAIDGEGKRVLFLNSGSITPRGDEWQRTEWRDGLVSGILNSVPAQLRVDTGSSFLALVPANRFDAYFPQAEFKALAPSTGAGKIDEPDVGMTDIDVSVGDLTVRSEVKRIAADKGPEDANLGFAFFVWTFTIFDAGQNLIAMKLPEVPK